LDSVTLREIEAIARIESAKMHHFYVGVEHLFIALTKLSGGIVVDIFDQSGQSPRYLRYATREMAGRGDDRRYWPGYRTTPRAAQVLAKAQLLIESDIHPDERALLLAILDDADNIPVRALQEVGVNLDALYQASLKWLGGQRAIAPPVEIDGSDMLSEDERIVLQEMFDKYGEIHIEHVFQEGFSGSSVLLVRPIQADRRSDAPVVVKIAERQSILWEKKRYDSFVKDKLPPTTARIEADPALPDRSPLGGLKYTFVRLRGGDLPINLREYAAAQPAEDVAQFLREALYNGFREAWWGQSQPYRFSAWQEYEFLLPPALVVEALPPDMESATGRLLRPLDQWSRSGGLHPGELVELENFTVQKVKHGRGIVRLSAGPAAESINRASQVEVHSLEAEIKNYFRGEHVRKIVGRILQTRDDILLEQVQALAPDFSVLDEHLPYETTFGERLLNPLRRYPHILEQRISGTLSTIHGDLHTGNVLIGPGGDAWLIDFEWTRDGHTLFDWSVLEVSFLIDHIAPLLGETWNEIWEAVQLLEALTYMPELPAGDNPLTHALIPVTEIRRIVGELLAKNDNWSEYYVALALCALRVIGWGNRPLAARRLAYLTSALAMTSARTRNRAQTTHSGGDLTDLTTDLD